MKNENKNDSAPGKIKIFLIDDDALILKKLEIEFKQHGDFDIETFVFVAAPICLTSLLRRLGCNERERM